MAIVRNLRSVREPAALRGWARRIAVREAVRVARGGRYAPVDPSAVDRGWCRCPTAPRPPTCARCSPRFLPSNGRCWYFATSTGCARTRWPTSSGRARAPSSPDCTGRGPPSESGGRRDPGRVADRRARCRRPASACSPPVCPAWPLRERTIDAVRRASVGVRERLRTVGAGFRRRRGVAADQESRRRPPEHRRPRLVAGAVVAHSVRRPPRTRLVPDGVTARVLRGRHGGRARRPADAVRSPRRNRRRHPLPPPAPRPQPGPPSSAT